jgi:hypothetical protein
LEAGHEDDPGLALWRDGQVGGFATHQVFQLLVDDLETRVRERRERRRRRGRGERGSGGVVGSRAW